MTVCATHSYSEFALSAHIRTLDVTKPHQPTAGQTINAQDHT